MEYRFVVGNRLSPEAFELKVNELAKEGWEILCPFGDSIIIMQRNSLQAYDHLFRFTAREKIITNCDSLNVLPNSPD